MVFTEQGQDGAIRQNITGLARISREASALIIVQFINTKSVMHAGIVFTFVDFSGAIFAGKSWRTGTDEVIDGIVASATVGTRVDSTFVDVLFAMSAREAG